MTQSWIPTETAVATDIGGQCSKSIHSSAFTVYMLDLDLSFLIALLAISLVSGAVVWGVSGLFCLLWKPLISFCSEAALGARGLYMCLM